MAQLISQKIRAAGSWTNPVDSCEMTYDARFLRRKVIQTEKGIALLVDLPQVTSLSHGDGFELANGDVVEIRAADEALLSVTSPDLPRIAWHIGNRHTPCQIEANRLLIQRDHVIADMLSKVGADVREVFEPFSPEGGAYGHGRTHGHDHSHSHSHSAATQKTHAHEH